MTMKKVILAFWVLVFLLMPLARQASACPDHLGPWFWGTDLWPPWVGFNSSPPDLEDLVFEGDFQFDLNGMYYVSGIAYPLNVLGYLEVFDNNDKLGDLSLNGQKNYAGGEWDGTYFGHWAFDPVGCGCDYEIGIFPDLSLFQQQGEDMLGFTLLAFNDVLGIEDKIPRIVGSYPPEDGEPFVGRPIPIPTTLLLLGSGLLGVVGLRRKKIKRGERRM